MTLMRRRWDTCNYRVRYRNRHVLGVSVERERGGGGERDEGGGGGRKR